MKKNIFYYALAAFAAVSLTACSSDDDDNNSNNNGTNNGGSTSGFVKPVHADDAALFTLDAGVPSVTTGFEGRALRSVELTESDMMVVEIAGADGTEYLSDNVTVNGNTYTFPDTNDKIRGTITMSTPATTRVMPPIDLAFNIRVNIDGVTWLTFFTQTGVTAIKDAYGAAANATEESLCRSWTFVNSKCATFDVHIADGGIVAFKDFPAKSGAFDLNDIKNEALQRSVALSDEDIEALNRQVKKIVVSKKRLIFHYANGSEDVADWSWSGNQIKIALRDGKMGNKFLNNGTTIDVAFDNFRQLCNLTLNATFVDSSDKEWKASLTLHLQ